MKEPITKQKVKINNKKKKIITLIVCIPIFIVLVFGAVYIIVTKDNENSLYKKLLNIGVPSIPQNLHVEDFDQRDDFEVLIRWKEVFNATGYTLEYKYEFDYYEVESVETTLSGRYVERKRGTLQYRVKAHNKKRESQFSEWQSFYIEPMKLELPEIKYTQNRDDNTITISWNPVEYKYYNEMRDVPSYELIDATYWHGENPEYTQSRPLETISYNYEYTIETFKGYDYIGDVLLIKIRALNYMCVPDEKMPAVIRREYKPIELYEIYDISEEWAEIEIEIENE